MSQFINKAEYALYPLYKEAVRRKLVTRQVDASIFEVQSFTRPNLWHRVEVVGDEARCFCESKVPQCTHIAIVLSEIFPVTCGELFDSMERREYAEKALKKRQSQFTRLLKERAKTVTREFGARPDGSFDEATESLIPA